MDHNISVRRPDLIMIISKNKNKKQTSPPKKKPNRQPRGNQRKQKEIQVVGPCQRTKKAVEHQGDGDTSCIWRAWNGTQRLGKGFGRVGKWTTNRDHAD